MSNTTVKTFAATSALLKSLKAEKADFESTEVKRQVAEAVFQDNGGNITNDLCKELCESGGILVGTYSTPQLRGIAVSMDYYQKKTQAEKASEHGTSQVRKASIVSAIETIMSMPKGSLDSLGKAQKPQLQALSDALIAMSDKREADAKA